MKPFQIQMFKEELSDLSSEQIAISVASHNGTKEHISMAKSVLSDIPEEQLEITSSMPLEVGEAESIWANPCSGKHSAILKGLTRKGLDTAGYTTKDHPYIQCLNLYWKNIVIQSFKQELSMDAVSLPTCKAYHL